MAAMPTAYGSIASPGFDLLTAPAGISQEAVVSSRDEQAFVQRRVVREADLSGGILNGYAVAADLAAVIEEHVKGERERERLKEEVRRLSAECDTARQRVLQMTEELEQERQAVQKAGAALAQQAAAQTCAATPMAGTQAGAEESEKVAKAEAQVRAVAADLASVVQDFVRVDFERGRLADEVADCVRALACQHT